MSEFSAAAARCAGGGWGWSRHHVFPCICLCRPLHRCVNMLAASVACAVVPAAPSWSAGRSRRQHRLPALHQLMEVAADQDVSPGEPPSTLLRLAALAPPAEVLPPLAPTCPAALLPLPSEAHQEAEREANVLGERMREWVEAAGGEVHPALRLSLSTPHGCRLCVFRSLRKRWLLHRICPARAGPCCSAACGAVLCTPSPSTHAFDAAGE